ncbi:hemolysin family protein [Arthrobacter sp. ATA002]|uniref:CNNM domain-containing protein n=1 Tax=Arthrobacter sp. ATA002 TaxID=2991715 RepID=UPI0022A7F799|nr:hemolysin family protein [Arthrobacter sp. ATA002]WAP50591.1 hemolysin family protein [Arthrobacter sp. ATA002]
MSALTVTVVTVLLIALSAFFVIIEFALLGARSHRLEADAATNRSARAALRGINELTLMLAGAQLGITACTFALGAVTKPAVDGWLGPIFSSWGLPDQVAGGTAFALSLLFVTFLHLVVGEMAPKSWAIAFPETSAKLIGIPSRAFIWTVRPLLSWINAIANRLVAASGVTPVERAAVGGQDVDTIRHLVEHSASVGALDASFRTQLSGVFELDKLTVRSLIAQGSTPTAVSEAATVADVQDAARRSRHMRILVADGQGGIPGVLHVRDTLMEPKDRPVRELSRPAFTLDADTPVYEALSRIRSASEQLAAVMEQDRFIGVITLADVLRRVLPSDPEGDLRASAAASR